MASEQEMEQLRDLEKTFITVLGKTNDYLKDTDKVEGNIKELNPNHRIKVEIKDEIPDEIEGKKNDRAVASSQHISTCTKKK